MSKTNRFSKDFRGSFPNKVARHFDKYVEYTNPVTFDPVEDIYRAAFDVTEWDALDTLLDSSLGRKCVFQSRYFRVTMSDNRQGYAGMKETIQFFFTDEIQRPSLSIPYRDLPEQTREVITPWIRTAKAYHTLRRELYARVEALLNNLDGFDNVVSGQGCNTVGQVARVWPDLLPFFPPEYMGQLRGLDRKSRLPKFFDYRNRELTPGQFRCEEVWWDVDRHMPYTNVQMKEVRRRFDAINHILTQMSLMKDVPHTEHYPITSFNN